MTWVAPERLHVTLRFIGDADEAQAAAIAAALAPPLRLPPFDATFDRIGVFPPTGPPRVLWVGVGAGHERLIEVERGVSERLASCGIPPEPRAYSPHLTLARVRHPVGLRSRDLVADGPAGPFGTARVDAITLFQSRLSPAGPLYAPLQRTPLQASS
jgi:2'-5' RNA ligase